jgi:hypothetical protein
MMSDMGVGMGAGGDPGFSTGAHVNTPVGVVSQLAAESGMMPADMMNSALVAAPEDLIPDEFNDQAFARLDYMMITDTPLL